MIIPSFFSKDALRGKRIGMARNYFEFHDRVDALMEDAIMAPTGGPAWNTDWVNGDHFMGASSSLAARSGYANITMPCGYTFDLPVGVSFFAGAFSEPTLIQIAYAFEQATQARQTPGFLPTLDI